MTYDMTASELFDALIDASLFEEDELTLATNAFGLSLENLDTLCHARHGEDVASLLGLDDEDEDDE